MSEGLLVVAVVAVVAIVAVRQALFLPNACYSDSVETLALLLIVISAFSLLSHFNGVVLRSCDTQPPPLVAELNAAPERK